MEDTAAKNDQIDTLQAAHAQMSAAKADADAESDVMRAELAACRKELGDLERGGTDANAALSALQVNVENLKQALEAERAATRASADEAAALQVQLEDAQRASDNVTAQFTVAEAALEDSSSALQAARAEATALAASLEQEDAQRGVMLCQLHLHMRHRVRHLQPRQHIPSDCTVVIASADQTKKFESSLAL